MKFKELSKGWKVFIVVQIILAVLFAFIFIGETSFVKNMREENAAKRAAAQKSDEERIGTRFTVERKGKKSVDCNLYFPDDYNEPLAVLFNMHGGGFMFGDADEMDTQCDHWAKDWNVAVVSVNYTKLDTKPIPYSVEEITDTMKYFASQKDGFACGATTYKFDTDKFYVIGHSAGGHLAAKAAIAVADETSFTLKGQILLCPWTTGLPDSVASNVAPAFFSLGSMDEISLKTPEYQEVLKKASVPVTVKEYDGGQHPFIHSPYPEFQKGLTDEEKAIYATEDQFALSKQAENDIKAWLSEMNNK